MWQRLLESDSQAFSASREEMFFKSGGGITSRSDEKTEYEELISKIYVPLH